MGAAGFFARLTAIVLLLAGLAYVVGWFMPKERVILKTVALQGSPATAFAAITELEKQRQWRSDMTRQTIESPASPRRWSEVTSAYSADFRETRIESPSLFEVEYETTWGVKGLRVFELKPTGGRTQLTITDTVVLDNPYLRIGGLLLINFDSFLDQYLSDLGVRVSSLEQGDGAPTPASTSTAVPTPAGAPAATPTPATSPTAAATPAASVVAPATTTTN